MVRSPMMGRIRAILVASWVAIAGLQAPALATGACRARAEDFAVCIRVRCAGLAPRALRACRRACRPARIRTLAYALTECSQTEPSLLSGRIQLFIRRGDCEPVAVAAPSERSVPDLFGDACRRFLGEPRFGPNEVVGGVFERLGVSLDGARVVFEVSDDFSSLSGRLAPAEEGIFLVRADGSGLRWLGPASRNPSWRIAADPAFPLLGIVARFDDHIPFSPDGRKIAFTDIGPDPTGVEASQIFILDLASGARTQVTHLTPVLLPPFRLVTGYVSFVSDETILFFSSAKPDALDPGDVLRPFTIRTDGSHLRALPSPVALPGSRVAPIFSITGPGTNLLDLHLPGTSVNAYRGFVSQIAEVFFVDGQNLLQITNYHRWDTGAEFLSGDGRRVFFHSSADPLGTNPSGNCQLFSVDRLGEHLRQVTRFAQGGQSENGCFFGPPPGCDVRFASEDPVTRSIVFYSSCDPFGTNPNGGQIFAMRADGTGLRQLTHARGLVTLPDGTVTVEIPGPFAYSARPLGTFPK